MDSLVSRKAYLRTGLLTTIAPVRAAGNGPRRHDISLGDNKVRARARQKSRGGRKKKKKDHQAT